MRKPGPRGRQYLMLRSTVDAPPHRRAHSRKAAGLRLLQSPNSEAAIPRCSRGLLSKPGLRAGNMHAQPLNDSRS
jgi:hypothetical protein